MKINRKSFAIISLLMLIVVSCQTQKVILYEKYENLDLEKKKEVDEYLPKAKEIIPKKENEIVLMLGGGCFFNQAVTINKKIKIDFLDIKTQYDGSGITKIANVEKATSKKIQLIFSNRQKVNIPIKKNYDYIAVCYHNSSKEWYIEYYDYPHLNFSE